MITDPTDIAGLQVWLNGGGTYWQDSARTTGASSDGDPVGAWDDASGNANHVLQATSGNRPTLQTAEINGVAAVQFGGSHWLKVAFAGVVGQPTTIALVGKTAASTTNEGKLFDGDAARQLLDESAGAWRLYAGNVVTGGTADDDWHTFVARFNGASSSLRVDGAGVIAADAGVINLDGLTVGADPAGNTGLTGFVAELVVYDSALAGANLTDLEAYFAAKYFGGGGVAVPALDEGMLAGGLQALTGGLG